MEQIKAISNFDIPMRILKPGELCIRTTPTILNTTLGSCLAIIMFSPDRRISVMSHPQLPYPPEHSFSLFGAAENRKYVNHVVPTMLRRLKNLDVSSHEIEVKVFGGAELLQQLPGYPVAPIGRMNVQVMLDMIEAHNLFLKVFEVGGHQGRKVSLYTHTGEVLVRRVSNIIQ